MAYKLKDNLWKVNIMYQYKKLIILIILLSAYITSSYAVEKEPPKFPKAGLCFKRANWHILFNEVFPKARFTFVVKNITPKEDIDIDEGVLPENLR